MTAFLWRITGPLAIALAAVLAGAPEGVEARPLDKTSCNDLAAERVSLAREHGIEKAIMNGPEWTRANMPDGTFDRVRRYLEVESDLRFRCRGKKPPWLISDAEKEAEKERKAAAKLAAAAKKKAADEKKKKAKRVKTASLAPLPLRNPKPMAERQPEAVVAEKPKPAVPVKAAVTAMPKLEILNGKPDDHTKAATPEPKADADTAHQPSAKPKATELAAVNGQAAPGIANGADLELEDPAEKAKMAALRADVPPPDRKPKKTKRRYVKKKKKKPTRDPAEVADQKLQQQVFPASR